jgi:DNA polymerase III subunit beta
MSNDQKAQESAMEISFEKSDLLQELAVAQGVVERKSTISILSTLLFEAGENRVLITATDLDVSLRTYCPATVKVKGACTIPARKFYDYVRLLPEGEIRIKVLENDWIQIRSGRSHTKVVGMSRKNFPNLPPFPADNTVRIPVEALRTAISKTAFAISQEESRYTINGALLLVEAEALTMVATDGHRLAHIRTNSLNLPAQEEVRVLIPKKALTEVASLLGTTDNSSIEFAKDESTLYFRIGSRLLTCRQLTGAFPNYDAVMPKEYTSTLSVGSVDLSQGIQRVSQFADATSQAVRIKVEPNQLRLLSSSSEIGESEETLETTYAGQPLAIGFNARYLIDFVRVAGSEKINFHFNSSDKAAEFRPEDEKTEDENKGKCQYRYIVMPMRV